MQANYGRSYYISVYSTDGEMKSINISLINLQVLNMDTIASTTTLDQSACYMLGNTAVHYLEVNS